MGQFFLLGLVGGQEGQGLQFYYFGGKGEQFSTFFGLVITHHITLDHRRSNLDLRISNLDLCRSNLMMNIRPM